MIEFGLQRGRRLLLRTTKTEDQPGGLRFGHCMLSFARGLSHGTERYIDRHLKGTELVSLLHHWQASFSAPAIRIHPRP